MAKNKPPKKHIGNMQPISKTVKKRISDLEKEQERRRKEGMREAERRLKAFEKEEKKTAEDQKKEYKPLSVMGIKRKLVIERILENVGNGKAINMGEIMRSFGYSQNYSDNPKQFTSTKTFVEFFQERLGDDKLTEVHQDLLNAGMIQHYTFPAIIKEKQIDGKKGRKEEKSYVDNITDDEIKAIVESVPGCRLIYIKLDTFNGGKTAYYQAPDNRSRKDALDMAYKVGGKYAPEKFTITRKYSKLSDEELAERIKKLKAKYAKK
jgi:hypothetical protein